jgi:copper transport protein
VRSLLLSCLSLLLCASPLHAHAWLVSSAPAAGERLERLPAHLTLTFSERVGAAPGGIAVTGPGGARVSGDPLAEGPAILVPLEGAAPGRYEVRWRVLAGDGHVVEGSFAFEVVGPPPPAPDGTADAAPPPTIESPAPAPPTPRPAAPWGRWLTLLGLALFTAGSALRQRTGTHPRVDLAALLGAYLLLGGGAAELLHHSLALTGSWEGALGAGTQRMIFSSTWGQLWLLRALAAGGALLLAVRARERGGRGGAPLAGVAVAAVISFSLAGASHAATLPVPAIFIPLDAVHRLGAALWVGGLTVLALLLAGREAAVVELPATLARFSAAAAWAIPVTVATGLAPLLYRFAGERPPLDAPYLQILLVKVALVAVAVGLGAYHRWRVVGRVSATPASVGSARWSLTGEALLAVVIVLLAGSLAATPPPS